VLFSVVDFLKNRYGTQKVVEVYKKLDENISLEQAFGLVCGEKLNDVTKEWQSEIDKSLRS